MVHAVAIRIDPFHRQIRTVWQPITSGAGGTVTTLDIALHSFHQLSESEFQQLVQSLMQWKIEFGESLSFDQSALQIHPLLHKEDAVEKLNAVFTRYLASARLTKITAMVLRGNDDMWAFMGLQQDQDQNLVPVPIARTQGNQQVQTFINPAIPFDHFDQAEIFGIPFDLEDNLNVFMKKATAAPTLNEKEIRENLNSIFKIENPNRVKEDQMDCVHCHVVDSAKAFVSQNYAELFKSFNSEYEYKNANYNLENKTVEKLNTRQIRGLGYFGSNVAISQRVINDSADVLSRWPY